MRKLLRALASIVGDFFRNLSRSLQRGTLDKAHLSSLPTNSETPSEGFSDEDWLAMGDPSEWD